MENRSVSTRGIKCGTAALNIAAAAALVAALALAAQLAAAVGRTAHWPDYASMLAQWPAPLAWLRWVLGI